MRKFAAALIFILFLSSLAAAGDFRFQIQGNYFHPSQTVFRDIYGSGFMYGFEIDKGVWKNIRVWLGARYFQKHGELTYTKERTLVNMLPVGLGIKYEYAGKEKIKLYAELGLRYNAFRESNVLGRVQEERLGFVFGIGSAFKISEKFFIDLFIDYSSCKFRSADFNIQIGGLEAGLGFGYQF